MKKMIVAVSLAATATLTPAAAAPAQAAYYDAGLNYVWGGLTYRERVGLCWMQRTKPGTVWRAVRYEAWEVGISRWQFRSFMDRKCRWYA